MKYHRKYCSCRDLGCVLDCRYRRPSESRGAVVSYQQCSLPLAGVLYSFPGQHNPLIVGRGGKLVGMALTWADSATAFVQQASVLLRLGLRCLWSCERLRCPLSSTTDGDTLPEPPLPFCSIFDSLPVRQLCPVTEATVFCTVLEESPCSATDTRTKFILSPQNREVKSKLRRPPYHCIDFNCCLGAEHVQQDFILAFECSIFCICLLPICLSFLSVFFLPFSAQVLLHRDTWLSDIVSDHTSLRVRLRHVLCRFYRVS